jgi:hypothetical protein
MTSSVDPDLVRLAKRLKLGPILPTLPERLALARAQQLDYVAFLTLLLADEVQRRDQLSLQRRLQQAGFEDQVMLEQFDWSASIQVDRRQLQALFTLEFLARKEHVALIGPVGVGKTMLLSAWARLRCVLATASFSLARTACSKNCSRPAPTTRSTRRSAASSRLSFWYSMTSVFND